jgi:hypothetical protein
MKVKLWRFKLGFLVGYLLATIRRADENDPMIRKLKSLEEGAKSTARRLTGRAA